LRKKITLELEEKGVQDAQGLATILASVGIAEQYERFISLFQQYGNEPFVQLLFKFSQLTIGLGTIDVATDKTRKVVYTLKALSDNETQRFMTKVNIMQTIETVLSTYQNYFKQGVELITTLNDCGEVSANREDLIQVWTNVIHNALQAMNYRGILKVTLETIENQLVVTITDNGKGIDPDIANRIFEPFFTTLPQGEGSGLGLYITQKIMETHHGTIEIQSQPQNTVVTIKMPISV